jgi:hypothetical protein
MKSRILWKFILNWAIPFWLIFFISYFSLSTILSFNKKSKKDSLVIKALQHNDSINQLLISTLKDSLFNFKMRIANSTFDSTVTLTWQIDPKDSSFDLNKLDSVTISNSGVVSDNIVQTEINTNIITYTDYKYCDRLIQARKLELKIFKNSDKSPPSYAASLHGFFIDSSNCSRTRETNRVIEFNCSSNFTYDSRMILAFDFNIDSSLVRISDYTGINKISFIGNAIKDTVYGSIQFTHNYSNWEGRTRYLPGINPLKANINLPSDIFQTSRNLP